MSKASLYASVAVLALAFAGTSQAQIKLEWHFHEGDTFSVRRETTQKQTAGIKSNLFKQERKQTVVMAVTVKQKSGAGFVLEMKMESVKAQSAPAQVGMEAEGGGMKRLLLHPTSLSPVDDGARLATALEGSVFTATVTPQGKLVRVGGYDDLIARLAKKSGATEKVIRAFVNEQALRQDIEEIFDFLPQRAIRKGDTFRKGDKWKRDASEPVPPFGSLRSEIEYTLASEEPATLAYKIQMSYKPSSESGEPFRIVRGSLKTKEGKGTLRFDREKGRLVENQKVLRVQGEVIVEARGNPVRMEFSSENLTSVQMHDRLQRGNWRGN